jgi:O-antigen/teichoic acid export membrane protein
VPRALLARRFEFSKTARAGVSGEIGGGIIGVAAALSGFGVWSLVFQRVAIGLIESVVLWVAAKWRPSAVWSRRCFSDVWLFSSSRAFEGLLLFVDQQAPRILLGRVAGAVELGYFVFARRIVENTVTLLNAPIRTTALSAFSAMQTDSARVRRAYAEGVGLTTAVVFPACAGIALVAPYLVPAMVGETWNPAVVLLQLLVLASIRQSFHIWNGAVLRGLGKPQLLLVASMVRTAVILALIVILLPWGAVGISIGILAGNYVSWPIAMRYVRRVTGVSVVEQLRPGAGPALAALAMAGVLAIVRSPLEAVLPLYGTLAVLILAGAACYSAALAFLGRKQFSGLLGIVRTLPGVRR